MNRQVALIWLQERFTHLYTKGKMVTEDVAPNGFKPVLDDTWDAMGVAYADEIPAANTDQFRAYARYYAYWHVCNYLVTNYSKNLAGMSLQMWQVFQGAKQMMEQALAEAKSFGLAGGKASYQEIVLTPQRTVPRSASGLWTEFG